MIVSGLCGLRCVVRAVCVDETHSVRVAAAGRTVTDLPMSLEEEARQSVALVASCVLGEGETKLVERVGTVEGDLNLPRCESKSERQRLCMELRIAEAMRWGSQPLALECTRRWKREDHVVFGTMPNDPCPCRQED